MVVAAASPSAMRTRKTMALGIPTIDLSCSNRRDLSKLLVEACEDYGFFKLINHGVPEEAISKLEDEGVAFFAKPADEKLAAGPATPLDEKSDATPSVRFGYGLKNIGPKGDTGELEYLLLPANPTSVSQHAITISKNPSKFSCAVNDYIQAVKNIARELLDLLAEGLWVSDKSIFSRMITDCENDSVFRINHYRPFPDHPLSSNNLREEHDNGDNKIGFGEHSDPQILTILRSNDVGGLQISLHDGMWVPISPDPTAYYIMVGDLFQVLTNGRFQSIKHRAAANSGPKPRMSMAYFASPSLDAWISPLPEMVTPPQQTLYRPFTWGQYKAFIYSQRLGGLKLDAFKIQP